jgi:hypothetical protein
VPTAVAEDTVTRGLRIARVIRSCTSRGAHTGVEAGLPACDRVGTCPEGRVTQRAP